MIHLIFSCLTVTRKSASFTNSLISENIFTDDALALVVADDESLLCIHTGLKLLLTLNMNKSIGFVNRQFVTVQSICNTTVMAIHPNGLIINIFPITTNVDDRSSTTYPCLPGYATTISKVHGQTVSRVFLWIDTETTPEGMVYVALSRVRSLIDMHFRVPQTPHKFTPVAIRH